MTNPKRDTIVEMQKNYDNIVQSHEDYFDSFEAGIRHGYSMAITDLQQLQVEPKQIDIDKIIEEIRKEMDEQSYLSMEGNYMLRLKEINDILTKHLTQKTTVPKDGEVGKKELEELREKAWKYDELCK